MPLKKAAQYSEDDEGSSLDPIPEAATIRRLYQAIDSDWSINALEKIRLLAEIKRLTNNAPDWTLLGNVTSVLVGGGLGGLLGKYFGFGSAGNAVAMAVGSVFGNQVYNRSRAQTPGWTRI